MSHCIGYGRPAKSYVGIEIRPPRGSHKEKRKIDIVCCVDRLNPQSFVSGTMLRKKAVAMLTQEDRSNFSAGRLSHQIKPACESDAKLNLPAIMLASQPRNRTMDGARYG